MRLPDYVLEWIGRTVGAHVARHADALAEMRKELAEQNAIVLASLDRTVQDVLEELRSIVASLEPVPGPAGPEGPQGPQGEPGTPGEPGVVGDRGERGSGLKKALIDREGRLVFTWDDGEVQTVGRVAAEDGKSGRDGADGAAGRDGADGKDGIGFDDMTVEHDGGRTVTLRFRRGEEERAFPIKFAVMLYQGVFKLGETYERGDVVSYAGSQWVALSDSPQGKPDESNGAWRLCVKRGRDGKDT